MTRRQLLAATAGMAALGSAPGGAALAAPKRAANRDRPNVLFVPIDDLNDWTGWLGGYPGVKTPNLDRLLALATGFRRAYTPAPACQPARASILFSREPYRSGVYTNKSADWYTTDLIRRPSIVRCFKDAGFATIGTGKVFHDGWRSPEDNHIATDSAAWDDYEFVPTAGEKVKLLWGPQGETDTQEDIVRADWLVKTVLSKTHDRPFFAAFGVRKPHTPWFVPQEFYDRYPTDGLRYPPGALDTEHASVGTNEDDADLPLGGKEMVRQDVEDHRKILAGPGWKSAVQAYLAAISLADQAVGVVLDGLLKGPNASNTIVALWSDHGWQLGEKLAWRKFTLWERATRVPLMIGGPGLRRGPSDALISGIDLYPTLVDLCGIAAPENLDGVSIAPYLRGEADEPRDHVISTWALDVGDGKGRKGTHFAVRTKTHRLIAYGNGDRELYDHRSDPWEWRNLLASRASSNRQDAVVTELERYVPKDAAPEAGGDGDDNND